MKIFAVAIAILVLFLGLVKPMNFGMPSAFATMENSVMRGRSLWSQRFEMGCGANVCTTALAVQRAADDCIRHCIQSALPAVEETAAFLFAPFTHLSTIALILLIGFLAQVVLVYALVRYLLYAYTFFHLRFVTSTILRN
ncbi:MAG: hypothetical protein UX10_C0002G0029 [Candidatus Magasanikbacteria bacterium GW2011_GWA2_45_39]|uniref:Uncharacterized protein n=2 Tax=Candidatus Magasanikiibacteriota TaxID=1752731 RepID=A0A0G1MZZ4_9BACT|nr:MAG: hypothetical protein UX10_C0002G0029 [Candidatus Magasanikbacteria bacterium GW2011_GWA2_45_39]KKU13662.1 MAG: hypothetical protein UX20_C0016G0010 [Candidatus Magasanikbacteria bacterium GW2011_GWC2_45_8]HBW74266.1 hypothetical protein [Candidatus Magasanikbacteria bacterium]